MIISTALCPKTSIVFLQPTAAAEQTPLNPFESIKYFEGCLPIEVMARRGEETLRFGPMKPVGLPDPRSGRHPHAVVQLRQDNADGSLYNLVGFQTKLKTEGPGAGLPSDPRPGAGRVCPVGQRPPEYLCGRAPGILPAYLQLTATTPRYF